MSTATIVIRKPFWRAGWFAGLVGGLVALLGLVIFVVLRARHRSAHYDRLTRLPNRDSFFRQLEREFEARKGSSHQIAVLILDLDHFRFVTNSLGHEAGDQLLVMIANRLARAVRSPNFAARLGSDEFAVLVRSVSSVRDVIELAEGIRTELSRHFDLDGQEIFSSASIGIAIGPGEYRWASNLLRDADTAMHGAKSRGLGGIEVFDRTMHSRALGLLRLESDLRRAIEREEFRLHYQPIVSMDELSVISVEALLRWQHPVAGLIGPDEFLEVAEDTGLILDIGDWVLREACRQLRQWRQDVFRDRSLTMHVNLSPRQLEQPTLAATVRKVLEENGLEPGDLVLEITEASVVGKSEASVQVLRDLRDLGSRLCIDDFGAGHSSLSYVRDLPVQCLKLDRSFISHGILRQWREIIDTILALGRSLDLPVIAEGIETESDYEQLRDAGCQAGQGYLFSRAVPAALVRPEVDFIPGIAATDVDEGAIPTT